MISDRVPSVMTAGGSNAQGQQNGLGSFMELLNAKIAKDLAIDIGISNPPGQAQQAR